jgi:2-oxoglutarate dehydrogenase complex dehydrogenase (E1) component-like enzyme
MSNRIITPEEMSKWVSDTFEKVADKYGLNGEERAKVLDQLFAEAFYEPTFRGNKK